MNRDTSRMDIRCKRAYEEPSEDDGYRVLVDRIWPRGVTKDALEIDAWRKDLAPSTELRTWFGHDPTKWEGFRQRYFAELDERRDAVDELLDVVDDRPCTLVYSARDTEHNQAVALREYLLGRPG